MRDYHGRFVRGHTPINARDSRSGKFLPMDKKIEPVVEPVKEPEQPIVEDKTKDVSEVEKKVDSMIVKPYRTIRL